MFNKALIQLIAYLGEKVITYVGELFRDWLREKEDDKKVEKCMAIKDPVARSICIANELNR